MKNPLFKMKFVIKGRYKANVGAVAGSEARAGAGAGAETKSFGSTTLHSCTRHCHGDAFPS